jgi:hypothetical protein
MKVPEYQVQVGGGGFVWMAVEAVARIAEQ